MRTFEIILIVIVFISLLLRFFRWEKMPWVQLFPLVNLLVFGYHLFMEGLRWTMIPLYLLALILMVSGVRNFLQAGRKPKIGWTIAGLAALLIFSPLPVFLPVPSFPQPDSVYAVGSQTFYWVDESREDVYAEEPGLPRRLMVQVWYPAITGSQGEKLPYLPDGKVAAQALATSFGFPPFFLSHFTLADTNAIVDAPLAECFDDWPVLLFSHGWDGMRYQSVNQMEELASQGYIVFAADHAYGAVLTVYPDGDVIYNKPEALPEGVSDEEYQQAARLLGETWVGDLRFLLDQIEKLQDGSIKSRFAGHLQLDKVGLFGHSTGGGAVLETCWLDARCKAVLAEDPWFVPYDRQMVAEGIQQPVVTMHSELWKNEKNIPLVSQFWDSAPQGSIRMTIKGTGHYDFSDLPLFSPIAAQLGLKGPIPVETELNIIHETLVDFFNQQIGIPAESLNVLPDRYPEIVFDQK